MVVQLGGELRLQSADRKAQVAAQAVQRGLERRVQVEVAEALGRRRHGAASSRSEMRGEERTRNNPIRRTQKAIQ